MNAARRTENVTIQLRLKLSTKTTDELRQIVAQRDGENPRRFLHDVATRRAASVILRTRETANAR